MTLEKVNSNDNSTVVNYSIMLYYTPQVKAKLGSDLDGFFDRLICETNQGESLICIHQQN